MRYKSLILLTFILLTACATGSNRESVSQGLTFIHLNDTYRVGAVESGNAGGFGRVVSVVRSLQAEGRDVRIIHGGDFLYPSLESQLWDGEQMIDAFNFMNAIAPLYVVPGNHEFDRRTPDAIVSAVLGSEFKWLGDNHRLQTGNSVVDAATRSAFTFRHGNRMVGVLALTLDAENGGNIRDYAPVDGDYLGIARAVLADFESRGVDVVIALTHLHIWQDVNVAALKAEYPKLLFVAGGHEHEPEFEAPSATNAAVLKGASNARVIWQIDVDFDASGQAQMQTTMIELNNEVVPDAEYEVLAASWRQRLLEKFPFLEARVGEAAVPLDGREAIIRNQEANWGNFVVDQMRSAFGNEPADLALINSGTLRIDDFVSGDITFEDIGRTFGFSSYLRYLSLSGAEFRQVLEAGYRGEGPSKGYFPQISGFRVCVDRSRDEGERIVSLQVPLADGWTEIDRDKHYSVVVPDFLYGGGDGYEIPQDVPVSKTGSELKYLVLDAVMAAQADGRKIGSIVDPANPRIVILNSPGEPCFP